MVNFLLQKNSNSKPTKKTILLTIFVVNSLLV